MKNIYKVFVFAFFLTSCIVTTTPSIDVIEEMPDNSAFIQENQDEIEMIAPDGWNTFKISDPIVLSIRNLSNNQIKFQQDYAANIYVLEDNTWTKINNNTIYPTQDDVILDPSDEIDPSKIKLLYLLPDLTNRKNSVHIRVSISGKILLDGESSKNVISFIDITLHP